jgi:hypothetical protein
MRIPKSKAAIIVVVVLISLVLSRPQTRPREGGVVVPMGALAHAAATLEKTAGGDRP